MVRISCLLAILGLSAVSAAQQLAKLRSEDFLSIQGSLFTEKPCGASSPDPEGDLSRNPNLIKDIDRQRWLNAIRRAKNSMEGYDKWWANVSLVLVDGRKIVFDGNGNFCIRTKDPKVYYFYRLDPSDFKLLSKAWNSVREKSK